VECDSSRRYSFVDFEALAIESPARQRREKVAKVLLPPPRKVRAGTKKQELLYRKVNACAAVDPGQRSERDWNLICFAIEKGVDREELWQLVASVGKFAERGRDYFDRTWEKAANHTREKIYDRNHSQRNSKASRNGTTPAMPSGPLPPDPPGGDGEQGKMRATNRQTIGVIYRRNKRIPTVLEASGWPGALAMNNPAIRPPTTESQSGAGKPIVG
jgi:hypothetical protein